VPGNFEQVGIRTEFLEPEFGETVIDVSLASPTWEPFIVCESALGFPDFRSVQPNSALNPVESFMLRVSLALRNSDISKPSGSNPTSICFTVNQGDSAGTIAN